MARPTNIILGQKAYATNSHQVMTNISLGGAHGYYPKLNELLGTQAYVRQHVIPILLEAPRFFDMMPNSELWYQSLKALVETRAQTIEGLNAGIKVDVDEHPVGGAGEMMQEPVNVTRERTQPRFTFVDPYGRAVSTFLREWIAYGLMDPDSKYANIGTLNRSIDDMLYDQYSMTMLFIEPDPTHRKVIQSWIVTNMFPLGNGDIEGKRDLTTSKEINTINVDFTGVAQTGLGTDNFAQTILDSINLQNANPLLRPPMVNEIAADVAAADVGYIKDVDTLAANAVTSTAS